MGEHSLPTEVEMGELDDLLEKASRILIRWRFKMTPEERDKFPTLFASIDRAEKAMLGVSNALVGISSELDFGIMRKGRPSRVSPQTYMDWINLTEDIKKYYPPGSIDVDEANFELGVIGGLEEGNPEEAKHWLVEKARELGINIGD